MATFAVLTLLRSPFRRFGTRNWVRRGGSGGGGAACFVGVGIGDGSDGEGEGTSNRADSSTLTASSLV